MSRPRPEDAATQTPMAHAPAPAPTGSAGDGNLAVPMPLGIFLQGIANIYDLAPKAIQRVVKRPTGRSNARREKFSRPLAGMLALSVIAFFAVRMSGLEVQGVLPEPLRLEWSTRDPGYQDRGFIIAASEVTFRTGARADSFTVHKIRHVTQSASGEDTTNFSVDYEAEGEMVTWKFQYIVRPSPSIRFANQKDLLWTPVTPTR